jgi:diguanylate cyclase (GGDEF)-like protein/PAS domain S-box-containing protein
VSVRDDRHEKRGPGDPSAAAGGLDRELAGPGAGELYRDLLAAAPAAVIAVDEHGLVALANAGAGDLLGRPPAQLVGRPAAELVAPCEGGGPGPWDAPTHGRRLVRDLVARRADGREVPVEVALAAVRTGSGRALLQAVIADVTERRRAEAELARRAARQAALARLGERALEGAAPDELHRQAVELVAEHLGAPVAQVLEADGEGWVARAGVGGARGDERAAAALARDGEGPVVLAGPPAEVAVRIGPRPAPFGALWALAPAAPDDLAFLQALANVLGDAVARHRFEQRMRHRALHDPLTGLANRGLLEDRLRRHLARTGRGWMVAVALVDLDHFKLINQTLGHERGDEMLKAVAARLCEAARPGDTVARLGGDEFVVVFPGVASEAEGLRLAEAVAQAFAEPFRLAGERQALSPTVGVAVSGHPPVAADALLRRADTALSQAKRQGRGGVALFEDARGGLHGPRPALEDDLRRALGARELALSYQPIVSLATGRVQACEALVRWPQLDGSVLAPGSFIPLAERSGLIQPLGALVLEQACREAARWRCRHHAVGVSVNLSPRQVTGTSLVVAVTDALTASGLPPEALALEITETALLVEGDAPRRTLRQLQALGVRLVLDDLGTGYSTLAHLQRLPVHAVKIDRSFVAGVARDRGSRAIVAAVLELARGFDLDVIAEGVEEEAQAAALRELGCPKAQGFHFARPLPPGQVCELLRRGLAAVGC